jgi:hypothetical protein
MNVGIREERGCSQGPRMLGQLHHKAEAQTLLHVRSDVGNGVSADVEPSKVGTPRREQLILPNVGGRV